MIVDHYSMSSKSQDDKSSKEKQQPVKEKASGLVSDSPNQEENKQEQNLRTVIITKLPETHAPLLGLTDYFTAQQKEKHELALKRLKKQGSNKSPSFNNRERNEPINDDQACEKYYYSY